MDDKMKTFDTDGDFKDNYKFLIGSIVPRPIAFISTKNLDGSDNLAPFSFFTAVSASPMIIGFSPFIKTSDGTKKDTLINLEREKECVVNFVTEDLAQACNDCGTELEYGKSEFQYSGLTPLASQSVRAMRLKESPIQFECKLKDILCYGDQPGSGNFVTLEVIKVHIKDDIIDQGRINTDLYKPVARGAGNDWIKCTDRFQLERKMKAQIQ